MTFRARLRDDNRCTNGNDSWGASARLDDDWACKYGTTVGDAPTPAADDTSPSGEGFYSCTILARSRVGFDDDGVPLFDWTPVVTAPAIIKVKRAESNAVAGTVTETGVVTVAYSGAVNIFETAIVRREDGVIYRVSAVSQSPTAVQLTVDRIDQQPDTAEG